MDFFKEINLTRLRNRFLLFVLTLGICSACSVAIAQVSTASVVGSLQDQSGAMIAGASITAVNDDTGATRSTSTNREGQFTFNSLDPGTYTLTFTAHGFQTKSMTGLEVTAGEVLPVSNVTLKIGKVSQTTTVKAQSNTVKTHSSDISFLISSAQIRNLVSRGRNFVDLVTLSPGVFKPGESQNISDGANFYVNGNRSKSNAIFIDGVPADDMSSTGLKDMVSQDAISQVQIKTAGYSAEYGRESGSNMTVVTKSGTRHYHGLLSYFNRNEAYNANNYFRNRNNQSRPRYRYNTITYNIGGPVIIPHLYNPIRKNLFFFWNQEFWPIHSSGTGRGTVPTKLEREGDFSQSYNTAGQLYIVKNPFNGDTPFPGNKIPQSMMDPSGDSLMKLLPLPNFTNRSVSGGNYNYVFTVPTDKPLRTQALRIDYDLSENNKFHWTFNEFAEHVTGTEGVPAGNSGAPLLPLTYFTYYRAATAHWMHVFTPSLLNDASFGFLYQPAGTTYSQSALQKLTRPNVGFVAGQLFPSANPLHIIPNFNFYGIPGALGENFDGRFPLLNRYYMYTFQDNVSYTHGLHNFKAGIYYEYYTRTQKTEAGGNSNGSISFSNNANNPLNTGYAYANAFLGIYTNYSERSIAGLFTLEDSDIEGYAQDDWRITPRLTLNYGLRLYYVTPFTEAHNQVSAFFPNRYNPAQAVKLITPAIVNGKEVGIDPGSGKQYPAADIGAISPTVGNPTDGMVAAYNRGTAPRSLTPGAGLQLGPRFGFAYDFLGNGKTALRGGIGVYQDRPSENYFDGFVGYPPIAQHPTLYYGQLSNLTSSSGLSFPNTVTAVAPHGHLARVVNYNFGVQQYVGFKTVLSVAYVGSQSRHLQEYVNLNAIPMGADFVPANQDPAHPGKPLPTVFLHPITGYNAIEMLDNGTNANYNSLQVTLERRFAHRINFDAVYTWSKTMDYVDSESALVNPVVPLRKYYYGPAGFDLPQSLVINIVYHLPRLRVRNVIADSICNNWVFSDISTFQTGTPFNVGVATTTGEDITGTPSISPRAVLTGNPNLSRSDRSFSRFFNTSVFRLPSMGTFGTASKNDIIGPGMDNYDMALMKHIPLHDRLNLELRFEAYNAFNHTQFSGVDATANFNPSTGAQINRQFGQYTSARDPRQLQLAARFTF